VPKDLFGHLDYAAVRRAGGARGNRADDPARQKIEEAIPGEWTSAGARNEAQCPVVGQWMPAGSRS